MTMRSEFPQGMKPTTKKKTKKIKKAQGKNYIRG